ncbi:MAG: DoxX family protein [Blastocatellia bacterium]|mgnify:CR=1 FL=1|nr:DoxX family protein [Blastocatellia bacterium]MBK6427544.1 DoxX family protein [Blastocatellia bacterium]
MQLDNMLSSWAPRLLSLMRIILAFLFTAHGSQKLFNLPPGKMPTPELVSIVGLAGVLEFGGGVLLLIGLFTRPVAFLLSGTMAVAYFMAHAKQGFLPIVNGGELAVVYCWVFLYLAAAGGGPWSVDALMGQRSRVDIN